jgi:NAD(P)-dependent dehydrogenase (short-subunit alcohol dehydrogenase family)
MTAKRACVFGAWGSIGSALVDALAASGDYADIYAGSRTPPTTGTGPVIPFRFDLRDEASIALAAATIAAVGPLDLVIVATGILHRGDALAPEKSSSALSPDIMAEVFALNTIGPALIAKHFLPILARDSRRTMAFLSARVGSIDDNRTGGWHNYRASKAALNMLVHNFAIEFGRRNPQGLVVALRPGTVDSALSKPFQRGVPQGKLMSAAQSARHLLDVIAALPAALSGGFFAWDGQAIRF